MAFWHALLEKTLAFEGFLAEATALGMLPGPHAPAARPHRAHDPKGQGP